MPDEASSEKAESEYSRDGDACDKRGVVLAIVLSALEPANREASLHDITGR